MPHKLLRISDVDAILLEISTVCVSEIVWNEVGRLPGKDMQGTGR